MLTEVVPGQVWVLDQIFGTFFVHVPIRATVMVVEGGLLVYAPVAATPECLRLVRDLEAAHGPVRWIVLPSKAVEHKVLAGPFAGNFPKAELYIAPGQFSVPVDLPLQLLGFPASTKVIEPAALDALPWAKDCETAMIDIGTFGEVALYHKRSRSLVLTDSLISIAEDPPPLLLDAEYRKALSYHARDDSGDLLDTPDVRRKGWARIALFACFFNPGGIADGPVSIPETGSDRPWQWQPGWEASFERLRNGGRPFVAPIIRELILKQAPDVTKEYVSRLTSWPFERVIPAHFSCPIALSPKGLAQAFDFSTSPDYCAEDLAFLSDLQKSAVPNGRPVAATTSCGYKPRS